MWCGACYTSSERVKFRVQEPALGLGESEKDPWNQAWLERAWGKRHQPPDDFLKARDGDHMMVPFECDDCILHKLNGVSVDPESQRDVLVMATIRRANLDCFWSRSTGTVRGNKDKLILGAEMLGLVNLSGGYNHEGPMPDYNHCGYKIAMQMLLYSRRPGQKRRSYLQLDTVRKLRTSYSNQVRCSPQAARETLSLGDQRGKYKRFTRDPCSSLFFYRFIEGCKARMGSDWKPNKAMSIRLLLRMLTGVEVRIASAPSGFDKHRWIVFHTFVTVTYVISLRGSEGFLLDIEGLRCHPQRPGDKHITLALLGKIKGESQDRDHLIPCSPVSSSGIEVKASVDRLIQAKARIGCFDGPVILGRGGRALSTQCINRALIEILEEIFEADPSLFPTDITSKEKLPENYQAFRMLRKTSDTRAIEKRVGKLDIDVVN
jgi:hypothetical protein